MPPLASLTDATYSWDKLHAGHMPLLAVGIILLTGQNRTRGALLGKRTVGAVNGAAAAGNTGNGTITGVAAGTAEPKPGVYVATCIEPAANLGTFLVQDPEGVAIGRATVGAGFVGPVNFTINDGGTDFVAGDRFEITVAAGDGKYLLSAATADDGSNVPDAILAEDCDASAADKATVAYVRGDFKEAAVTLGAGHTAASVREGLRDKGIHLIKVQE